MVRRLLGDVGVSLMETELVVLELVERLYWDECRRLRSCRARSLAQFRAGLRRTALHFALDWLRHRVRRVRGIERPGVILRRQTAGERGAPTSTPRRCTLGRTR